MADYYSLLARAVAALPQSAPQTRQAVYERARKALFNQLRSIQPPVAEEDIEAEGRALDEAIARLELEVVREQTGREPVAALAPKEKRAPEPEKKEPVKSVEPVVAEPIDAEPKPEKPVPAEKAPAEKPVEEAPTQPQRPPAPLPPLPEPTSVSRRVIVIGGVLAAVVALVAVLALQFRERPEDLAKLQPEPSAVESGEGGKLADRIGGESDASPPPSRAPSEQRSQPVAVAQKAELWVAAPEEAAKVKTYPGTVVWRLDSMPAGPGEPVSPAIRGEIDFPTAKLKTTIVIQKNLDPTLSASHTVNLSFNLGPGNELKRIKAIGPIQMRRPEAQSGEQVAGVPVPITDNAFLIGLLRGNREARNVVLLRSPMVLDLPLQLEDGRAATISLEKGPGGERVFADALDAWTK
ncbi:hypothetical protein [Methylosinus sp. PW1]|uniref:hypothetical protein n=1 Tax=Methylosinus sp. PW1 TaxID=107636 RepID=UPI00055D7176|nr:hypothetical protein [Methylosinus sp. PW1]